MTSRRSRATASGSFVLQKVTAIIPAAQEELRVLETYLEVMGCSGLLGAPWAFANEALATELQGVPDARFDGMLRAHPERWTETVWRETYQFREGTVRIAERNDEFLKGEFLRVADPKDGYVLADLKNPDARLVMGFLNPIFHPEKPKRVVAKLASLCLGAMRGKHQVNWAALMREQVDRMVTNLSKGRKTATPVSTYVGHLYGQAGELTTDEQEEFDKLLSIQSYGGPETDSEEEESEEESEQPPLTRKRSRSVQRTSGPEQAGPSQRPTETATQTPAASGAESAQPDDEIHMGAIPAPDLSGHLAVDIVQLAEHIARRAKMMQCRLTERAVLVEALMGEAGANTVDELFDRIAEAKKKDVLLRQMEERQTLLNQTNAHLQDRIGKLEANLREAFLQMTEAQEKANASGKAMEEVRTALSFPVDTVNRALLFTETLERDEKLNRGQIIRFLLDHGRKMEKTWSRMQELVRNMFPPPPIAAGPQSPDVPILTPATDAGTSQGTPASFNDLVGTPDFGTPNSWSSLTLPNTEAFRKWQQAMPEGWPPVSPPTFRIPSESPSPDRQRGTPPDLRPSDMEISPSVSLRDLPETSPTPPEASTLEAQGPEPPSGQKGKEPESPPGPSRRGKTVLAETPRRRSPRKKGVKTP